MKSLALGTLVLAAMAVAATPSDAAKRKSQSAAAKPVHARTMPANVRHPYDVYSHDGVLVGRDPDPFIRLMIMRDPKPWEASGQ